MAKKKEQNKLNKKPTGDYIPLCRLQRMVEKLKDSPSQTPITFEFLMASCFPTIFDKISDRLTQEYIKGYNDGRNDKADRHN